MNLLYMLKFKSTVQCVAHRYTLLSTIHLGRNDQCHQSIMQCFNASHKVTGTFHILGRLLEIVQFDQRSIMNKGVPCEGCRN